jgi:tetratricopeptide (TPR) repeat protein
MNQDTGDWPGLFQAGIERAAQHWLSFFGDRTRVDAETWAANGGHALRTLTWCIDSRRYLEVAADLALALHTKMMYLGYWQEWETLLRRLIVQATPALDAERLWELTQALGSLSLRLHRFAEAIALAERNDQLAATRGDLARQQAAQIRLAEIHLNAEHFDQALGHAEEATELAMALGDPIGEADSLINAARALMDLGDIAEAERRLTKALALTRRPATQSTRPRRTSSWAMRPGCPGIGPRRWRSSARRCR